MGSAFAWASERNQETRGLLWAALTPEELAQATTDGEALTTEEAIALAQSEP